MSEAITKACETCAGVGRPITFWNGTVDCVDCSGTGRVPDEVATLRAELDAARAEVALQTSRAEAAKARAETQSQIVRLTLASVLGRGHEERDVVELAADVVRVVAELKGHVAELDGQWQNNADLAAELDAAREEVARLTCEVNRLAEAADTWRDAYERSVADDERMTAEVDRLTAREREAARILSFVPTAHASAWSAEAEAWLAGCAP